MAIVTSYILTIAYQPSPGEDPLTIFNELKAIQRVFFK